MYKIEELTKTSWRSYDKIPNKIPPKYVSNAERLVDLLTCISKKWEEF